MAENSEIVERAAAKLLRIVKTAARMARARMFDELTKEELEALQSGPPPKMPLAGTIEHHLASALLDDGKRR